MKYIFIFLISLYQWFLSPIFRVVFGATCRYSVPCSEYTKQQIKRVGVVKGGALGIMRLLSCQPFGRIQRHDSSKSL
jgi:putative membrane protein insertion efficiency factor